MNELDKVDPALPAGLEAAYAHHVEDQIEAASCAIVVMPSPARPPECELWHPLNDLDNASGEEQSKYFEPQMLEPMQGDPSAGRVSLGVWICWIMTDRGTNRVRTDDRAAWIKAVAEVRPYLTEFKLSRMPTIDLEKEEEIALLNKVEIFSPYDFHPNDVFQSSNSYIQCAAHFGDDASNDKLFLYGKPRPALTDFTVAKSDILSRWPRVGPSAAVAQSIPLETSARLAGKKPPVKRAAVVKGLLKNDLTSTEKIRSEGFQNVALRLINAEYEFLKGHYPKKNIRSSPNLEKMLKVLTQPQLDAALAFIKARSE